MKKLPTILNEDFEQICSTVYIPWEELRDKTILITGATGIIGSNLVNALLYVNKKKKLNLSIIALVRDVEKAKKRFIESDGFISFLQGDVTIMPEIGGNVDFIIHGASPTASAFFAEHPVETIDVAVKGTKNMLELARDKKVSGFIYLSSMEVYGSPHTDDQIYESTPTNLDTMSVRSCYPEAKRLCENMCVCYASEFQVPAKVIRLSQTFGPGIAADDGRVFAQFAKSAKDRTNIVLQTKGESKRTYLYTADAVTAVLTVLLKGESAQAYNAANPETYCSIMDMAKMVVKFIANNEIEIEVRENISSLNKYPPTHSFKLNADKLMALGWKPTKNLIEMYERMIDAQ